MTDITEGAKQKYQRFKYSEENLQAALTAIRNKSSSLSAASVKYGIPKGTLHNKISQKVPEFRKMGPQSILSAEEESKLEKWILGKAKVGFPMHPEMVKDAVQSILKEDGRQNPFTEGRPGKKWLSLFLKRKPEIVRRNTEIISKARAAVTEEKIRNWFAEVVKFMEEESATDVLKDGSRIFNCDEIGMLTCPKMGLVLGPKGFKNFYEIANAPEKESITVLCTYSATGEVPPPMVVLPYKRIPRHIVNTLPDEWAIGHSDSGWMVSSTFYELRTYHGHENCSDSIFQVWKECMKRSSGSKSPSRKNSSLSQKSDLNVNTATHQVQEIGACHLSGLGVLDQIPIDIIGSDVDFPLTDIAQELEIVDGSNLVICPIEQVQITSAHIIENTILGTETEEPDVSSVLADETSHKISAVEMKEIAVKKVKSRNAENKENDVPLSSVPADHTFRKKPTIVSNVIIREASEKNPDYSSNKIWDRHLHWPKAIDKTAKKVQQKQLAEQVPFAITSKKWKEIQEKKQNEILEKQRIAANRLALREEKKKQKEEEKATKNKIKIKKELDQNNNTAAKRKIEVVTKDQDLNDTTVKKEVTRKAVKRQKKNG